MKHICSLTLIPQDGDGLSNEDDPDDDGDGVLDGDEDDVRPRRGVQDILNIFMSRTATAWKMTRTLTMITTG